ncbi:SMI1/KNR4 family protein [Salmonella enterica subsp. enterica]
MNILEAYWQLNFWIDKSNGDYIDVGTGERYAFSRLTIFTEDELSAFELNNNLRLPDNYKNFLIHVGCVNIFSGENTAGIEILSPTDIKEFSKSVFFNFGDDLYPTLLLTTSIPKLGYFGGFWMEKESKDNYGIFYPEIPSELWIEECDFIDFDNWVIKIVEYKSKKI